MSAKQDRQGARTVPDLERKYKFGESFAEVMGIATDARKAAELAQDAAENPSAKLTQDEIFNLLTNNGANQGIYRAEDGEIYINASYLKSGVIDTSLIKSGILQSADGSLQLNLNTGALIGRTPDGSTVFSLSCQETGSLLRLLSGDLTKEIRLSITDIFASIGFMANGRESINMWYAPNLDMSKLQIDNVSTDEVSAETLGAYDSSTNTVVSKKISWKPNGDGTYTLIGT